MISEIFQAILVFGSLTLIPIVFFLNEPEEKTIHVWTFSTENIDEDSEYLIDESYGQRIEESTEVY